MKPGYKQTEVGVIPEEWEVKRLNEVADLQVGFAFKSDWFGKHIGPRLLRGENVGYGTADWSDTRTLEGKQEAGFSSYLLNAGEVVIGMDRTFTKTGSKITLISEGDCPCLLVQRVGRFVPRKCEQSFLWFVLSSETVQARLRLEQKGMDIPHLSRSEILHPFAIFPPLPEQRAIAKALGDVDGLLDGLDRLIAKKRDLKQAAMQQLLTGQTRLPGFHGEWEAVRLGDVADPSRSWSFTGGPFGSNLKSSDYTESGVRIIQLQNIGDGEFKDDYEIYTSVAKADELLSCNIYPGEIILSKMGDPVARACIIPARHNRYLMCSDGIRLAVDSSRFANNFVFAQINAPDFRNRAANAGTGSTRKRIGLTELRNLALKCPPTKAEQTAIAEVLTEMDAELAALEQRREKTRALRQAMMQELLTGRTRLV